MAEVECAQQCKKPRLDEKEGLTPGTPDVPEGEHKSSIFGMYSSDYDKYRPSYPNIGITTAIDIATRSTIHPSAGIHVVDLACGTGKASMLYARQPEVVAELTCIDHDERMLEECQRIVEPSMSINKLSVKKGSAEQTGLGDSCCDLIGVHTAFHWFNAETALKEFHRILKDDGILALAWNNQNQDKGCYKQLWDMINAAMPGTFVLCAHL